MMVEMKTTINDTEESCVSARIENYAKTLNDFEEINSN